MRALRAHLLDAWLNGESLREADGRIRVTNIRQEITTKSHFGESTGVDGRRRHPALRELIRVTVEFGLLEIRDVWGRESALEAANAWAGDGLLEISTKPGRRLRVTCQGRACAQSPLNPKESYTIVFETAESPFWEDTAPKGFSMTGSEESDTIRIPGTAEMYAEAAITPLSAELNTLTISLGDSTMTFSGLAVPAETTLSITHDEHGYLRIMAGNQSRHGCRAASSADELAAGPGPVTASYTANTACAVTFFARGRYR